MTARQRLWRYIIRYKALLAAGIVCVLITNLGQMIGPIILRDGIDDLTSGVTQAKLLYYGGAFIAINLVAGFFVFLDESAFVELDEGGFADLT